MKQIHRRYGFLLVLSLCLHIALYMAVLMLWKPDTPQEPEPSIRISLRTPPPPEQPVSQPSSTQPDTQQQEKQQEKQQEEEKKNNITEERAVDAGSVTLSDIEKEIDEAELKLVVPLPVEINPEEGDEK